MPTIRAVRAKLAVQEARSVAAISKTIMKKPGKLVGKGAESVGVLQVILNKAPQDVLRHGMASHFYAIDPPLNPS